MSQSSVQEALIKAAQAPESRMVALQVTGSWTMVIGFYGWIGLWVRGGTLPLDHRDPPCSGTPIPVQWSNLSVQVTMNGAVHNWTSLDLHGTLAQGSATMSLTRSQCGTSSDQAYENHCFYRKCKGDIFDLATFHLEDELTITLNSKTSTKWNHVYASTLTSVVASGTSGPLPINSTTTAGAWLPPQPSFPMLLVRLVMRTVNLTAEPSPDFSPNVELYAAPPGANCGFLPRLYRPITPGTDFPLSFCHETQEHFYTLLVDKNSLATVHRVLKDEPYNSTQTKNSSPLLLNIYDHFTSQPNQPQEYLGLMGWGSIRDELLDVLPQAALVQPAPGSDDSCWTASVTPGLWDGHGENMNFTATSINMFGVHFDASTCTLGNAEVANSCISELLGPGFLQVNFSASTPLNHTDSIVDGYHRFDNFSCGHVSIRQNADEAIMLEAPVIGSEDLMRKYAHFRAKGLVELNNNSKVSVNKLRPSAIKNGKPLVPAWFYKENPDTAATSPNLYLDSGYELMTGQVCVDTTVANLTSKGYFGFCLDYDNSTYVLLAEPDKTYGFIQVAGSSPQAYSHPLLVINDSLLVDQDSFRTKFLKKVLDLDNAVVNEIEERNAVPGSKQVPGFLGRPSPEQAHLIPSPNGQLPPDWTCEDCLRWRVPSAGGADFLLFDSTPSCAQKAQQANCHSLKALPVQPQDDKPNMERNILGILTGMEAESVMYQGAGFQPGFMRLNHGIPFSKFIYPGGEDGARAAFQKILLDRECKIQDLDTCSPACLVLQNVPTEYIGATPAPVPPPTLSPTDGSSASSTAAPIDTTAAPIPTPGGEDDRRRQLDLQMRLHADGDDAGSGASGDMKKKSNSTACAQRATLAARYFFFLQLYKNPHPLDQINLNWKPNMSKPDDGNNCIESRAVEAWTREALPEFELRCVINPYHSLGPQGTLVDVLFRYEEQGQVNEYKFYSFGGNHSQRHYVGGLEMRCEPCLPIIAPDFFATPWLVIFTASVKTVIAIAFWFLITWRCNGLNTKVIAPCVVNCYIFLVNPVTAQEDKEDLAIRMKLPYNKTRLNMQMLEERLAAAVNTDPKTMKRSGWPKCEAKHIRRECADHFVQHFTHGETVVIRENLRAYPKLQSQLRSYYGTFLYKEKEEEEKQPQRNRGSSLLLDSVQLDTRSDDGGPIGRGNFTRDAGSREHHDDLGSGLLRNLHDDTSAFHLSGKGNTSQERHEDSGPFESGVTEGDPEGRQSPRLLSPGNRLEGNGGKRGSDMDEIYSPNASENEAGESPSRGLRKAGRHMVIGDTPSSAPSSPARAKDSTAVVVPAATAAPMGSKIDVKEVDQLTMQRKLKRRKECINVILDILSKNEKTWEPMMLNKNFAKQALRPLLFYLAIDATYCLAQAVFSFYELAYQIDIHVSRFQVYELFWFRILNSTTIGTLIVNSAARLFMMTRAQKAEHPLDMSKGICSWTFVKSWVSYVRVHSPFLYYSLALATPPMLTHVIPGIAMYPFLLVLLLGAVGLEYKLARYSSKWGKREEFIKPFAVRALGRLVLYFTVCGVLSCAYNWMCLVYEDPPLVRAYTGEPGQVQHFDWDIFWDFYGRPIRSDNLSRSLTCFLYMWMKSVATFLQVTASVPFLIF